jgi:hypothetical protein
MASSPRHRAGLLLGVVRAAFAREDERHRHETLVGEVRIVLDVLLGDGLVLERERGCRTSHQHRRVAQDAGANAFGSREGRARTTVLRMVADSMAISSLRKVGQRLTT